MQRQRQRQRQRHSSSLRWIIFISFVHASGVSLVSREGKRKGEEGGQKRGVKEEEEEEVLARILCMYVRMCVQTNRVVRHGHGHCHPRSVVAQREDPKGLKKECHASLSSLPIVER